MTTSALKTFRPAALALLLALVVAACGSGVSVESSTGEAPTVQAPSEDSDADEPEPTAPASNPDEPEATVNAGGELLLAALSQATDPGPFRVSSTTAQVLRSSALGVDQVQEADPERPTTVIEVSGSGDSYLFLDLGPIFAPLAAGDPAVTAALDTTRLEMWTSADALVIDATGYQAIADLNPAADLGPFNPGIGMIDLNRLGGLGGADLAEALVGGVVNPAELAARLPAILANIVPDPLDPLLYTATSDYAPLLEAMGADLVTTTRGVAIGIAPAIGLSVDDLAAFYQNYYASVTAELVIALTPDGALSSISVTTDLSSVYTEIYSEGTGLDLGLGAAELADTRELFADTVWIIEASSVFEFDDTIVVSPPTGDFEDRTDVALEFFAELIPG